MALSDEQELVLRTWVGDDPTTSYLEDLYAALGSYDEVVRSVINRKIATLAEQPSSISVPGLSISNGQQLVALQELLKRFNASGGTGLDSEVSTGILFGRLVRNANER
jgi:hypothetical protein